MTLYWFWTHRDKVSYSLNQLYLNLGVSKQAFHEWLCRWFSERDEFEQLLPVIRDIRADHPAMSARVMYDLIKPETLGRDKFIRMCRGNGFNVQVKPNKVRTTNSTGVIRFPNLIKDLKVIAKNQVWVSDITYYRIGGRFFYITFIMDLKTRFIVGYNVSQNLKTGNTTLPALVMAINHHSPPKGLFFHSDGGGQYYCKEFVELTGRHKLINSMTEDNAENNHAERVNGTIKNQYLSWYGPTSFPQLLKATNKAVFNYNFTKPHSSLNKQTPACVYGLFHKSVGY